MPWLGRRLRLQGDRVRDAARAGAQAHDARVEKREARERRGGLLGGAGSVSFSPTARFSLKSQKFNKINLLKVLGFWRFGGTWGFRVLVVGRARCGLLRGVTFGALDLMPSHWGGGTLACRAGASSFFLLTLNSHHSCSSQILSQRLCARFYASCAVASEAARPAAP